MSEKKTEAAPKQACRACGAAITEKTEHFPFCSERCRFADLGKWFDESYRVSRPIEQADLDQAD